MIDSTPRKHNLSEPRMLIAVTGEDPSVARFAQAQAARHIGIFASHWVQAGTRGGCLLLVPQAQLTSVLWEVTASILGARFELMPGEATLQRLLQRAVHTALIGFRDTGAIRAVHALVSDESLWRLDISSDARRDVLDDYVQRLVADWLALVAIDIDTIRLTADSITASMTYFDHTSVQVDWDKFPLVD